MQLLFATVVLLTSILDTIYGTNILPIAQAMQKCKLVAFKAICIIFLCTKTLRSKFEGVVGAWVTAQMSNFSYRNLLLIQMLRFLELAKGVRIIELGLYFDINVELVVFEFQ